MSWAEIKKAVNSNLDVPLNEQLERLEVVEINGKRCKVIRNYRIDPVKTLLSVHSANMAVGIRDNIMYQINSTVIHINNVTNKSSNYWSEDENIKSNYSSYTHAIVVNDKYIYIMGGGYNSASGSPNGRMYDFDSKINKTITNPIRSSGSWAYHTMVEFNGNVFVLGGNLYAEMNNTMTNFKNTNIRLNLDSEGDYVSATVMNDLPMNFANPSSVVFDNEIRLFNGINQYKSNDGSTWTFVSSSGFNINYNKAVVYNDEIHAFYETKHYKSSDGITWTQLDDTPFSIQTDDSVFVAHRKIYVLGSRDDNKGFNAYKDGQWLAGGSILVESGVTFEPFDGSETIKLP